MARRGDVAVITQYVANMLMVMVFFAGVVYAVKKIKSGEEIESTFGQIIFVVVMVLGVIIVTESVLS